MPCTSFHDGSEYLHLQTELSNALEKNQNISCELEGLKDTHSTCDEYIEDLINKQNELKSLTQRLAEKEDECTALSTSILKKDQEMSFVQKEVKDKEFQCCRLIEEADLQRSNIRDLEENILKYKEQLVTLKRLQDERDQLNSLLLNANNYSNKLEEEIDDLQNQIDSIKNTVLDQQDKIKLLTNENTQAKEKLLDRERQIAELHKVQEESRVAYTNSVSSLKDDLRNIEAKCNKLESHEKVLKKQLEQSINGKNGLSQSRTSIYTQTGHFDVRDFGVQFPMENEILPGSDNESYSLSVPTSRKRRTRSSRRKSPSPPENECSEIDVTDFSLASNDIFDIAGRRIHELEATDSEDEVNCEKRLTLHETSAIQRVNGFLSDDELSIEELGIDDTGYDNGHILNTTSHLYDIPVLFNRFRKLKGCENLFRLYIAKYTYDPSLYSPNEDHDLELPLEAGMQVYVYGEMDEDGFYLAESKTGNRGLVPSNLVELVGDGLNITRFDSSAGDQMLYAYASDDEVTEVPPLDADAMRRLSEIPIPDEYLQQSPKVKTTTDVLGSTQQDNVEKTHIIVEVPPPRSLRLDRQLHNSTVMCWQTPVGIKQGKIKGYSIYVDGKKRQTILGSSRTKALVSDIDQKQAYRISVHTLTISGDESRDELAVVTVGTGVNIHAPFDVKVKNVRSLTADLSWKPSNSSYYHAVYKNNENITTLQPGVCVYALNKLIPDNTYTIKVQSRKYISKGSAPDWARCIEFRTALGVKPDAPLYVCSEVSRDLLQVSWLPVTINEELGSSNGSIVTGYNVYVNERQCATVKSPTSDTVNIPLSKFTYRLLDEAKEVQVLVRTQSTAGESDNSNVSLVDVNVGAKPRPEKLSTSQFQFTELPRSEKLSTSQFQFTEPPTRSEKLSTSQFQFTEPPPRSEKLSTSSHFQFTEPPRSEKLFTSSHLQFTEPRSDRLSTSHFQFTEPSSDKLSHFQSTDSKPSSDKHSHFQFMESDMDELQESVIDDEPCSNEPSLDESDPNYQESLDPTWSEISVAFNETDSIKTHFNPENEPGLASKYITNEEERIIVSDGELSVIEEVSEPESVLTSRLLECSAESLFESSLSLGNKTEPLKASKSVYNKLTKSEPVGIHKVGRATESSSSSEKWHVGMDSLETGTSHQSTSHGSSTHSSTNTYTVKHSHSDDLTKSTDQNGHKVTSPLELNRDSTFTLSPSEKRDTSNCSSSNNTYTILPDVDPKDSSEQRVSGVEKSNSASSYSSACKSTRSDSNSMMDDSLIESVQMSSMKLSGIIASQVSELSTQLSSIVFSCESDDEANSLPVDDDILDKAQKLSNQLKTKNSANDSNHIEGEMDDRVKTVELDTTSKAVIELPRDNTMYASGELDTSRAVTDLTEDSSKASKKETLPLKRKSSSDLKRGSSSESLDDEERVIVEIPNKVSVAARISEFENQKEHLKIIKTKSNSLPCEDSLKNELPDNISSLSNGYHSSGESVFSDCSEVCSAPKVKPKPQNPKKRTLSLTETRDIKEKYSTVSTSLKEDFSKPDFSKSDFSTSPTKIGFIDADKFSSSQNKLTIQRSLHSNDTHLSGHVLSNGISAGLNGISADSSSDEEKCKSSSDEEIKFEIFNIPQQTVTTNTSSVEVNNIINESYLTKSKKDESKKCSPTSKSYLIESRHTGGETSSDEYSVNEKLNLEHSETNDQTTILYNSHNGDDRSTGDNFRRISEERDTCLIMKKPVQNMYSFGGDIDISSSEQDVSEINDIDDLHNGAALVGDANEEDGNDDFNVTQMNEMEESTVSRISTVRSDSEKLSKSSENHNEVLKQIHQNNHEQNLFQCSDNREENMFQCSSPLDSRADVDPNLLFECPLPAEYQKEYDERSIPDDTQKCRIFVANFSYDPLTMSPNVELVEDELAFCTGDFIKVYGEIGIDGFYFGELNGKRGYLPGNMVTEVDSSTSELKKLEPLSNGDSFFDLSTGNRKLVNPEQDEEANVEGKNILTHAPSSSGTNSATKLRESRTGKRGLNSKSSSTNNLSRDSGEDFIETQAKSCSMPNVSSDYFDRLEYDIDEDLYDPPDPYLLKPVCMISLFPYDPATSSPNVDAEVELSFNAGEIIEVYGEMDEDGFFAGKLNNFKGLVPSNFVRKATEKEILKGFCATSTTTSVPQKKKTSLFKKSKKIFSRLKGK